MPTDLNYTKNITQFADFQNYINSNFSNLTLNYILIEKSSSDTQDSFGNVKIQFEEDLTEIQMSDITLSVQNYINSVEPITIRIENMNINSKITTTNYEVVTSFIYEGTKNKIPFGAVNIGTMKNTTDSIMYSVRLVDTTNNNIICETTGLSNDNFIIDSLGVVSNLPENNSLFEIQCKLNVVNEFGVLINAVQLVYYR